MHTPLLGAVGGLKGCRVCLAGVLLCHVLAVFMCCVASLGRLAQIVSLKTDVCTGIEQSGVDIYLFTGQINE